MLPDLGEQAGSGQVESLIRPGGYFESKGGKPMRYAEPAILRIVKATASFQGSKDSIHTEAPETPSLAPAYQADE